MGIDFPHVVIRGHPIVKEEIVSPWVERNEFTLSDRWHQRIWVKILKFKLAPLWDGGLLMIFGAGKTN